MHMIPKEASIASIGKGGTRKEVKEEGEGSFSPLQATQRTSLCVSVGYLFRIMISDMSGNTKGICKPKTKSKMVLENDSLWRLIFILLHMRLVKQTGLF